MKLVSLNIWGGKVYKPLLDFFERNSKETDIFCLQELLFGSDPGFSSVSQGRLNIFSEIKELLPGFEAIVYRTPEESHYMHELLPEDVGNGQAIFVKNGLAAIDQGGFRGSEKNTRIEDKFNRVSGRHQWVVLDTKEGEITLMNLHGIWQKETSKGDTPERIMQSKHIQEFFENAKGRKILCGDFNLKPDGESMKILEHNMINVNKKFGLITTRSSHYTKSEKYADYVLTSPDIDIVDFKVLQDEVSDHLPLFLEFR